MSLQHLEPLTFPVDSVLGDVVYRVLGEAIADGRLAPGLQLRDVDVAQRLGISRTPVREALQRLERIGLVDVAANRYTRVSVPSDKGREDTREFVVYTMSAALRMALPRCTDAELAALLEHLDRVVAVSDRVDVQPLVDLSFAFYQYLTVVTDNSVFIAVMSQAAMTFRRNLEAWPPFITDPTQRRGSYEQLREAVATRRAGDAERIMREQHGHV